MPQLDVDAPVGKAQVQQPLRATLVAALQRRLPCISLKAMQRGLVVCAQLCEHRTGITLVSAKGARDEGAWDTSAWWVGGAPFCVCFTNSRALGQEAAAWWD